MMFVRLLASKIDYKNVSSTQINQGLKQPTHNNNKRLQCFHHSPSLISLVFLTGNTVAMDIIWVQAQVSLDCLIGTENRTLWYW